MWREWAPALEAVGLMLITLVLAVGLGLPTLWLVAPFTLITLTGRSYEEYGLVLSGAGPVRLHIVVTAVVLGSYALLHCAVACWWFGLHFEATLPPEPARRVLDQLVVVGLSEEFFFRGYLQTQLNRCFGRPYMLFGARWGHGLIVAALLFGLCHLVNGDITRLRVVFFGLFAGWLRERTKTIAVPAVYHGASNLLYDFLQRSLR